MTINFDKKIGVVGLGYVGLPLAILAAEKGWEVIGYDKNMELIRDLSLGKTKIPGISKNRVLKILKTQALRLESKPDCLAQVDLCLICLPTPVSDDLKPDLSILRAALIEIGAMLPTNCVLINESTSFPGTLREVIKTEIIKVRGNKGDIAGYVSAPERIDPTNINFDLENTPRVIGGLDPQSTQRAFTFYSSLIPEVFITSTPEVAEFSKLLENSFRLVNISLVNEIVPLTASFGIDIREVIDAAATKPFGFMKFYPGPGIGGHCIPVDPHYLLEVASKKNVRMTIIESAFNVNSQISGLIVSSIRKLARVDEVQNILLIGIAYKEGISDTRETPAKSIAKELKKSGFNVFWVDPLVDDWDEAKKHSSQQIHLAVALSSATVELVCKFTPYTPVLDCTGRFKNVENVVSYLTLT